MVFSILWISRICNLFRAFGSIQNAQHLHFLQIFRHFLTVFFSYINNLGRHKAKLKEKKIVVYQSSEKNIIGSLKNSVLL